MRCDARDAMREPMRCELVAMQCAALRCMVRGLFAIQCDARGLVAFTRCRQHHAFDWGIFRVGFFWVWFNTHQCSYGTRADRRVKGWLRRNGWMGGVWGMGGQREKVEEWVGGFAKVDNRFGYEKWLQGGCIGLALLWSKIKKLKFASSFASPEKENYIFIFMLWLWSKIFTNGPLITTGVEVTELSTNKQHTLSLVPRIFRRHQIQGSFL
jgi:hypothetical protein